MLGSVFSREGDFVLLFYVLDRFVFSRGRVGCYREDRGFFRGFSRCFYFFFSWFVKGEITVLSWMLLVSFSFSFGYFV